MAAGTTAHIGLGSNVGDRKGYIDRALEMLAEAPHTRVVRTSDLHETEPLGATDHPKFLNGVVEVATSLSAEDLYRRMAGIEAALGRERPDQWSPRTIDLDLLLFGNQVIDSEGLTVPHPQMHLRSFVLSGMCELAGGLRHPVLAEPMSVLSERLGGGDFALEPDRPQLVSVAGVIGVGKTTLTRKLAAALGCEAVLEAYDENPFLAEVYGGKRELSLDSQLFFLTSRVEQLSAGSLAAGELVVTDYVFDKELIYARRTLDGRQLSLYEKLYGPLRPKVAEPVLVVYLQDSAQRCLERIHRRNRPYEQSIELKFLDALNTDYQELIDGWRRCPVIRMRMSQVDLSTDSHIDYLKKQVRSYVVV